MSFFVTPSPDATTLINSLLDIPLGDLRNIVFNGDHKCPGLFDFGYSVAHNVANPICQWPDQGSVFSTGKAIDLMDQDSSQNNYTFGWVGDAAINSFGAHPSYDTCSLSFEFQCLDPYANYFSIDYVFASEWYNEAAGSDLSYAGRMGILLNDVNIALVPYTIDAVSVSSVNHVENSAFYVNNDPRSGNESHPMFEPDGFTTCLTAGGLLNEGWNTLKIGVVDVGSDVVGLDTSLFLKEGSFQCSRVPPILYPIPVPSSAPTQCNFFGQACGDPHFRTFDGQYFSYHGQCDIVLTRSNGFASGLGLDIHIRTTRVNSSHMSYSYISGAAVKMGADIVEVSEDGSLIVNGESVDLEEGVDDAQILTFGNKYTTIERSTKGSKKRIVVYDLDIGDDKNIQIRANTKSGMLFIDVNGAFSDSEGLLGAPAEEGKPLLARDGITNLTGHWNTYGEEWQVNNVDPKLFQDSDRHPQFPSGCQYVADDEANKSNIRRRRLLDNPNEVTHKAATDACAHLEDDQVRIFCMNDIMATGDLDLIEDPFYANNYV